jgi:cobalt-zinc-cadmium resistance protein CzcA
MVYKLIAWSLDNPLIAILLAVALFCVGVFSFFNVNVEAYPDPAPAIVEVVALFPGAPAEEVERRVTIPLEVTLAGMPGLKYTHTKSLFGLSFLRNQFDYGIPYDQAKQEVINRLQFTQPLPPGVTPTISPESPTGEIYRYTLHSPKYLEGPRKGQDIYTLNDLKALQDWVLEREFRRVPGIIDVSSSGGTVKRYEVHPDPNKMRLYGITLPQLQAALSNSNANVGGGLVKQGNIALNVRSVGLFGGGLDPASLVLGMEREAADSVLDKADDLTPKQKERVRDEVLRPAGESREDMLQSLLKPLLWWRQKAKTPLNALEWSYVERIQQRAAELAAKKLREEDNRRIADIRKLVITSVNNKPIRVEHIVEGADTPGEPLGVSGVVVGHQERLGRISMNAPKTLHEDGGFYRVVDLDGQTVWRDEDDKVQCIVLLRKGADSLPVLKSVEKKVDELNNPESGKMLPGVKIEPYYDRTDLINVTTETVRENLFLGMVLVTAILLMFLSNVRSALIVAINIPLALLFAFTVLFLRGKSANLLSIGAVDFGIIVDSSVIMVENIYRHLSSSTPEHSELRLKDRILRACHEIERPLFFSTAIMVCAFIPLFTMQGPEGQIFGPMAQTYAFALCGALLLALILAPVLCLLLFRNLKPAEDNFFVRWIKRGFLRNLGFCLNRRLLTLTLFAVAIVGTAVYAVPRLGGEFMPELEEGNLWIRGTMPLSINLDRGYHNATKARSIMIRYPEVETVVNQLGRPDDGTDSDGFYNAEFFVPLRPQKDWPAVVEEEGWRGHVFGAKRPRTKEELVQEMNDDLNRELPGINWNFSQNIRDNVMESLSGVKGDNSLKIIGPDLEKLEEMATKVKERLEEVDEYGIRKIKGIENVGIFHIKGASNLEFRVDPDKCARYGVAVADVNNVVQTALGALASSSMIEGEKIFDIAVRWPKQKRGSETSILDDIFVDLSNNTVAPPPTPNVNVAAHGTMTPTPALPGTPVNTANNLSNTPRVRLRELVSPVGKDGAPDPNGQFIRAGASTIYREQGDRIIAIKFEVRGRDLAGTVAEAQEKTQGLFESPYRAEWSGEFKEMEEAEYRLYFIVPGSLVLIFALLYFAFRSIVDALLVMVNVVALSLGGVWALLLTGTHFSISAAVGFISIFGVAIMDGLLLVAYFNQLRARGMPLREAIMVGAEKRVRPVMMTALTAIFGLLPAALSTRIGAQTQRPLAIVVVGGMIATLFLTRYLMPVLYSFYGHREPPAGSSGMAH